MISPYHYSSAFQPPSVSLGPGTFDLCAIADAPLSPLVSLESAETEAETEALLKIASEARAKHRRLTTTALVAHLKALEAPPPPPPPAPEGKAEKAPGKGKGKGAPDAPAAEAPLEGIDSLPLEQLVWRRGPMARIHRWDGTYAPNKALKLLEDVLATEQSGTSPVLTLRVEVGQGLSPHAPSPPHTLC